MERRKEPFIPILSSSLIITFFFSDRLLFVSSDMKEMGVTWSYLGPSLLTSSFFSYSCRLTRNHVTLHSLANLSWFLFFPSQCTRFFFLFHGVPSVSEQARNQMKEGGLQEFQKLVSTFSLSSLSPIDYRIKMCTWLLLDVMGKEVENQITNYNLRSEWNKLSDVAVSLFTQFPCLSPPHPSFCDDRISSFYPLLLSRWSFQFFSSLLLSIVLIIVTLYSFLLIMN